MSGHNGTEAKKTARATATPSLKDLHWAAGFIEGEGSFVALSSTARVSVEQVNKEPVSKLMALFGGSLRQYHDAHDPTIYKKRRHQTWVWWGTGSRARGVIMTLYPLMSVKRQRQMHRVITASPSVESERI